MAVCATVVADALASVVTGTSVGLRVKTVRAAGECVGVAVAVITVTTVCVAWSPGRTHAKAIANTIVSTTNGPPTALTADALMITRCI